MSWRFSGCVVEAQRSVGWRPWLPCPGEVPLDDSLESRAPLVPCSESGRGSVKEANGRTGDDVEDDRGAGEVAAGGQSRDRQLQHRTEVQELHVNVLAEKALKMS